MLKHLKIPFVYLLSFFFAYQIAGTITGYFSNIKYGNYTELLATYDTNLILFTTSTCPFCKEAKLLLEKNGIAFQEFIIDKELKSDELYEKLAISKNIPLMILKDKSIEGYNKEVYLLALLEL